MKIILILCSCFFLNLFTMDSSKGAVFIPELDLELAAKALARMQKSESETLQNSRV